MTLAALRAHPPLQSRFIMSSTQQKSSNILIRKALTRREFSAPSSSMKQQYDLSTWLMYQRIVSSRISKKQFSSVDSLTTKEKEEETNEIESPESVSEPNDAEEELMFELDL
eukprot:CAMPEP_0116842326 /NCGR_PEP_ID=MMETSP0418-20121206/11450_1 /TAXON_ID=1158023 /ORGANISM="Astrosyne radiata, Strain 13vi08-1A" /LENGTH=111 /DNA_ID=CAMNT_0004472915 /DNA_START=65 /DNA_END=400 /DNA_ORIENTATION=-